MPASMRHWQRVRELAEALPPDPDTLTTGAVACSRILMLGWRLQSTEAEVSRHFEDGKRMAEEAGNKALMARLYLGYAIVRGVRLAYADDYLTYTFEAARLARELDDFELQCGVESYLPWAHLTNGNLNEARDAFLAVGKKLPNDLLFAGPVSGISAWPLINLAEAVRLTVAGHLSDAQPQFEKARAQMEQTGFVDGMAYADFCACKRAVYAGDVASAHRLTQALFEIAEKSPMGVISAQADIGAGFTAFIDGDINTAIELLERARRISLDNRAFGIVRLPADPYLVEALLKAGATDKARERAEESLTTCREHNFKMTLMPWISTARVHIRTGGQAEARALIDEAAAILEETGARTFEPFLHECRAEFAQTFASEWSSQEE